MILVDTSVWIDMVFRKPPMALREQDLFSFATCGPIVQEVLKGFRPGVQSDHFRDAFLAIPTLSDPIPLDLFVSASAIYQHGRSKGFTIRSSIDCLIAAIAIENHVPVWHRDRDFDTIARYTTLRVAEPRRR